MTVDPADAVVTENTSAADATEFSIKFGTDYVKSLEDDATLTLHYTVIITSDALQTKGEERPHPSLTKQCKHFSSIPPAHGPASPISLNTVHWTVFSEMGPVGPRTGGSPQG